MAVSKEDARQAFKTLMDFGKEKTNESWNTAKAKFDQVIDQYRQEHGEADGSAEDVESGKFFDDVADYLNQQNSKKDDDEKSDGMVISGDEFEALLANYPGLEDYFNGHDLDMVDGLVVLSNEDLENIYHDYQKSIYGFRAKALDEDKKEEEGKPLTPEEVFGEGAKSNDEEKKPADDDTDIDLENLFGTNDEKKDARSDEKPADDDGDLSATLDRIFGDGSADVDVKSDDKTAEAKKAAKKLASDFAGALNKLFSSDTKAAAKKDLKAASKKVDVQLNDFLNAKQTELDKMQASFKKMIDELPAIDAKNVTLTKQDMVTPLTRRMVSYIIANPDVLSDAWAPEMSKFAKEFVIDNDYQHVDFLCLSFDYLGEEVRLNLALLAGEKECVAIPVDSMIIDILGERNVDGEISTEDAVNMLQQYHLKSGDVVFKFTKK